MTDTPNPKEDQQDQKSVNEEKNLGVPSGQPLKDISLKAEPTHCDNCVPVKQWTAPLPYTNVRLCPLHAAAPDLYGAIQGLLDAERCPNCPDQGWYADGPTDDPEQVQCEWCECYPQSLFKAKQKARAALAAVAHNVPERNTEAD